MGEGVGGECGGADDHEEGLEGVRVDDGGEAAGDGADGGHGEDEEDGPVDVPSQRRPDEEGPAVHVDGDLGEDVEDEAEDGEVDADAGAAEALVHVLGERGDAGRDVDGEEDPAEDLDDDEGVELEGAHADPRRRPAPRQPDEVLGADVGREERRPHRQPRHEPTRQEVPAHRPPR